MLIKWIVCQVPEDLKPAFSEAQQQWRELRRVDGFLGQIGGWSLNQLREACIMALWKDETTYRNFMDHVHDEIFHKSAQRNTYSSIAVVLGEKLTDIPGQFPNLVSALGKGTVLRTADCLVKAGCRQSFLQAQREIWNPGMQAADGMLAGMFSQVNGAEDRYLVATLWTDPGAHQAYCDNRLPPLRTQAATERDIERLSGRYVLLENSWTVS